MADIGQNDIEEIDIGMAGANFGWRQMEGSFVAIEAGLNAEDLALSIHPHPTLSETPMEAAEAIYGRAGQARRQNSRRQAGRLCHRMLIEGQA